MALDVESIYQAAADAWPDVNNDDLIWVAPLGSRRDALIFNRATGRVTTGRRGSGPCFEGSLDDFAEKLEQDYGHRLETPYGDVKSYMRWRAEYRQAIQFLKVLPDL